MPLRTIFSSTLAFAVVLSVLSCDVSASVAAAEVSTGFAEHPAKLSANAPKAIVATMFLTLNFFIINSFLIKQDFVFLIFVLTPDFRCLVSAGRG